MIRHPQPLRVMSLVIILFEYRSLFNVSTEQHKLVNVRNFHVIDRTRERLQSNDHQQACAFSAVASGGLEELSDCMRKNSKKRQNSEDGCDRSLLMMPLSMGFSEAIFERAS